MNKIESDMFDTEVDLDLFVFVPFGPIICRQYFKIRLLITCISRPGGLGMLHMEGILSSQLQN